MKWIRLTAPPGSIILNTGDYMQRISNDLLPSTTHRVSLPRDPTLRGAPRASHCPWPSTSGKTRSSRSCPASAPPKYEPVKAVTFHTRITSKYYGDDYAVVE